MTRVLHVACHTTNVGDGAVVCGLQAALRADRPALEFKPIDLMRARNWWGELAFDEAFFRRADGFDLLLVGGGGLINAGTRDAASGFAFDAPPELLARSRVPVVFYAAGVNLFPDERLAYPDRLNAFLDAVRAEPRRIIFSVRDDGSLGRLEAVLGRRLDFVPVVPDPGLYVRPQPTAWPQFRPDRRHVLVQLAGDRPDVRFGPDRRAALARLGRALSRVAAAWDVDFVLTPHLVWDMAPLTELMEVCPPTLPRFRCDSLGVVRGADRAAAFFDAYRRADMVIGMRGHAAICSVGLGVPFIGLGGHEKLDGFLAAAGLGRYAVGMTDPELEERVAALADELLGDPALYRAQAALTRERAAAATRAFHERVFALTRADSARTG